MIPRFLRPQSFNQYPSANPQPQSQYVQSKQIGDYQYQLNNTIGRGYSSVVYRGQNIKTKEPVSLKVIDMHKIKNPVQKYLLSNEIRILRKLNHKNILGVKDIIESTNNTYIITEFCDGGDLGKLLRTQNTIPESQAKKYLFEILQGYSEIFQKNILHRDFKPSNIFLKDQTVKIADFGFAIEQDAPKFPIYHNVGSPNYMCPQALQSNTYNFKSDIWGIGVVYYEILYGDVPWDAPNEKDLIKKMLSIPPSFPSKVKISEESKDFIRQCLNLDESKRIAPAELLQHPLFKEMKQEEQEQKQKQSEEEDEEEDEEEEEEEKPRPESQQGSHNELVVPQIHNQQTVQPQPQHREESTTSSQSQISQKNSSSSQLQLSQQNSQSQLSNEPNNLPQKFRIDVDKPDNTQEESSSDISTPQKQIEEKLHTMPNLAGESEIQQYVLPGVADSMSNKQIEDSLICDLYFCKFLNRIYKMLQAVNILQSPFTKQKIQFVILKNIMMRMTKLDRIVANQRLQHTNLNIPRLKEQISKYNEKFRSEFNNFFDNDSELQKLKRNLVYERGFETICDQNFLKDNRQFYDAANIQVSLAVREINYLIQQEVTKGDQNQQELSKEIQQQIILLDYLITLYQLYNMILQNYNNSSYFVSNCKLEDIVNGAPAVITKMHHQQIRNKMYILNI